MRTLLLRSLTAAALLLGLSGCVTWQTGGRPFTASKGAFSVTPPAGWMFIEHPAGTVRATRDGLVLQEFIIAAHELKQPLPTSKRVLSPSLTPYELAEAIADDLRSNRELLAFEILTNEPSRIDGREGFAITMRYQTKDKLRITTRIDGVLHGDKLYTFRFAAPTRYYFERDLPAFKAALDTFKFTNS